MSKKEVDLAKEVLKQQLDAFKKGPGVKKAMDWADFTHEEHYVFYELVQAMYKSKMFYDNGEAELFAPPTKDFTSVLECVVNLKK